MVPQPLRRVPLPIPPGRLHQVPHAEVVPDRVLEVVVQGLQQAPEDHHLQRLRQAVVGGHARDPGLGGQPAHAGPERVLGRRDHEGAVVAVEALHGRHEGEGHVRVPVQHSLAGAHHGLGWLGAQAAHHVHHVGGLDVLVRDASLDAAQQAAQLERAPRRLRGRQHGPGREGVARQRQRLPEHVRFTGRQGAEGVQVRGRAAGLEAAESHVTGVAAELGDVAVHEGQGREDVLHARVAHGGVLADAQEAQRVKAVVGHDEHDVLLVVHEALGAHVVE